MSWDMNQVNLIGRLTSDPVLRYSSQGNPYCQLGIAVGRKSFSKDSKEDEVFFFNVVVFGKMAEISGEYLTKGKQVAISGYLRHRRWEKDGAKLSTVEIVAERVQFLTPNPKRDKSDFDSNEEEFTGSVDFKERSLSKQGKKEIKNNLNETEGNDFDEDDIPF